MTITMLTSVSCDYGTSFNYDRKKIRDVHLTYRCYLGNIMSDSMVHESMGQLLVFIFCFVCFVVITVCYLFFSGWYFCFL